MKKVEIYLNIVHFCYYNAHYKMHLLTNKINPFRFIHRLPFQKRRYEKLGIDIQKEIDAAFENKNFGLSTSFAGGMLFTVLFFLIFGMTGLIRKLFTAEYLQTIHFIVFGLLSAFVCYVFVFKKDKYVTYFDTFEKWSKEEKRNYSWVTFAITIFACKLPLKSNCLKVE